MVKKCVAVGDIFITSEMMKAGLEKGYEDLMLDVKHFYFGSYDRHEMRNVVKIIETGGFETLALPEGLEEAIEDIKNGRTNLVGFLVGQVIKKSQGKANPGIVSKLVNKELQNR